MAVALQASVNLVVSDGGALSLNLAAGVAEAPTAANAAQQKQSIGTGAWVALNVGLCSPADWIAIKNTDAANYVQLATDNAGAKIFSKLKAGRSMLFPQDPGVTIYAKANTAAVVLVVVASEA